MNEILNQLSYFLFFIFKNDTSIGPYCHENFPRKTDREKDLKDNLKDEDNHNVGEDPR